MISVFDKKEDCCGCTACEHICPTNAIKMTPDEEGFVYPVIGQELCIDCGRCRRVCAFQNGYDNSQNLDTPNTYGVKHIDNDVRIESRSGGVFTALSDYIIDKGGLVYGDGNDKDLRVCHKKAVSKKERNEFRGSKYVQSDLNDVFLDIANELITGKEIMFTGTPCQTAGLREYLNMKKVPTQKLLLCDIICHGAPTQRLFMDYIEYIEQNKKGQIREFQFRNKKLYGWKDHRESYIVNNKTFSSKMYTNLFYEHSSLRPSCYNCKYTNMTRPSDITLADFWGVDEIFKGFNDNKGVSLIFINTNNGKKIFDEVKEDLIIKDCTGVSFVHPNLKEPTKRPLHREQFWKDYDAKGFKYITKKYGGYNFKSLSKRRLKYILEKAGLLGCLRIVKKRNHVRH